MYNRWVRSTNCIENMMRMLKMETRVTRMPSMSIQLAEDNTSFGSVVFVRFSVDGRYTGAHVIAVRVRSNGSVKTYFNFQ